MDSDKSLIGLIESAFRKGWLFNVFYDIDGDTFKYSEVACIIRDKHRLFKEYGIERGDKIAICGDNCARWCIAYLSALTYGAVPVPILNDFKSEQIYNIVNHSETVLLYMSENIHSRLNESKMPDVKVFANLESIKKPDTVDMKPWDVSYVHEESGEQLAMINYTSGTTGFSKGVMIPYRAIVSNYEFVIHSIWYSFRRGARALALLPLAHMYGFMYGFMSLFLVGMRTYFLSKAPSPSVLAKAFKSVRPSVLVAVPLILEKIVNKQVLPQLQKSKLIKFIDTPVIGFFIKLAVRRKMLRSMGGLILEIVIGGAALNSKVEQFLRKIHFPLAVGFGATECAPIIAYSDWKHEPLGSCGKAVRNMELSIDSTDPQNVPGEILARGSNVMLGYYKADEETERAIDKEGWYHTGDMGVIDKRGYLYIKGRIKSMILGPSGQNIYPEELEDQLQNLLFVDECVVVKRDNKLVALVYPDYEEVRKLGLNAEHLKNVMALNLQDLNRVNPAYEMVSSVELMEKEFEKTPKRSIKRFLYT